MSIQGRMGYTYRYSRRGREERHLYTAIVLQFGGRGLQANDAVSRRRGPH